MINKLYKAYKRKGLQKFFITLISRILNNSIALPIALLIVFLSPIIRIRLIKLYSWRIGHYGLNTHLLLCYLEQHPNERKKYKNFFYADPHYPICNKQLHTMWKKVLIILPFRELCYRVDKFLFIFLGEKYRNDFLKKNFEDSIGGYDKWGYFKDIKKSFISFSLKEKAKAKKIMAEMGIPLNEKFICLLARDSKYLQVQMPDSDCSYHDYRNAEIDNYKKTIEFLAKEGYYVIRMGKHVHKKLEINHPNVIDYANHKLRSDFMDVYFSAHCYFFMSTSTGIDSIAQIFRRPILVTNFPLCDLNTYYNWYLFIPKKIFSQKTNRFLTIKETVSECKQFINTPVCKGLDRRSFFNLMERNKYYQIENSPDEILEAVKEMLKLLNNQFTTSENEPMQKSFWEKFEDVFNETDDSYKLPKMRVADSFLKKHLYLLD